MASPTEKTIVNQDYIFTYKGVDYDASEYI